MKKLFALLMAMVMVFALAACGNNETPSDSIADEPDTWQGEENDDTESTNDDIQGEEENITQSAEEDKEANADDEDIPTTGTPLNWPDNEYTKLVPTPNAGGKVLSSGEIGTLYAIELKWSMDQGLIYVQQLQDAGFGDDCVEKYQKNGTLDRTANGVNIQVMDLFGVTSISIMKAE